MRGATAFLLAVLPLLAGEPESSPSAFEFATNPGVRTAIDRGEILKGLRMRNPRDGIPTILEPRIVAADRAAWLGDGDRVLGLVVGDEARAYPLRILEGHELVNDVLGGRPVAPTY